MERRTHREEIPEREEKQPTTMKTWIKRGIGLVITVILIVFIVQTVSSAVVIVPSGYRGILLNWGEPIAVLGEGFHTIIPVSQAVDMMSVQVQKAEAEESTASLDLQEITTTFTVNYRLNEGYLLEIYKNLRNDYESRVIRPAIEEGIKASTANFTTNNLIKQRELVKVLFKDNLDERLSIFHIDIIAVSITNFQFSADFQAQVDRTATASQKALEEKNNLDIIAFQVQQQVLNASAQYNVTILNAQAQADATILRATADAEAKLLMANAESEAIRLYQEQLAKNPAYIQYILYRQWNGQFPVYWFGGSNGATPFILFNMPSTNQTAP